jgi:hypothetical protein
MANENTNKGLDEEIPMYDNAVLLENFRGILQEAISDKSISFDEKKAGTLYTLISAQAIIDFNVAYPKSIQQIGKDAIAIDTGITFNGLPDRTRIQSHFIEVKLADKTANYINEPISNIPKGQIFVVLNARRYMHEDYKENDVVISLAVLSKKNAAESYLFDEEFTNQKFAFFIISSKYHPAGKGSLSEEQMEKIKKNFPKLNQRMADIVAKGTAAPDRSFGLLIPTNEIEEFLRIFTPTRTPMDEVKELWEEDDKEL